MIVCCSFAETEQIKYKCLVTSACARQREQATGIQPCFEQTSYEAQTLK